MEKLEKELTEECNKIEEEKKKNNEAKKLTKGEKLNRLMVYSKPKINIAIGIFWALV